jgi:hypothetical protein
LAPPNSQVGSGGGEFLHPAVLPIGDIDVALAVEAEPPGHIELARATAVPPPHSQELAVLGELLHTAIQAVHYVEVILLVKGQT